MTDWKGLFHTFASDATLEARGYRPSLFQSRCRALGLRVRTRGFAKDVSALVQVHAQSLFQNLLEYRSDMEDWVSRCLDAVCTRFGYHASYSPSSDDWLGGGFEDRLGSIVQSMSDSASEALLHGRSVDGAVRSAMRGFARLATTESYHALNQALLSVYADEGVQSVSVSCSESGCPVCSGMHGRAMTLDEASDGLTPPFHPNCTCVLLPYGCETNPLLDCGCVV